MSISSPSQICELKDMTEVKQENYQCMNYSALDNQHALELAMRRYNGLFKPWLIGMWGDNPISKRYHLNSGKATIQTYLPLYQILRSLMRQYLAVETSKMLIIP